MWRYASQQRPLPAGPPPGPPDPASPPPSRQNKVILQREYREKESECFNALRDIIKDLTGQAPRTRHEILRKVIDILVIALNKKQQSETSSRASTLIPYSPELSTRPEQVTSAAVHMDCQAPFWLQQWCPGEFDAVPYYDTDFDVQQCYLMSCMNSVFDIQNFDDYPQT